MRKEDIINTIENIIKEERQSCSDYIKLNPGDAQRRERDMELVIYGLMRAMHNLTMEDIPF